MSLTDAHFVDCAINPDNPASGSNLYYPTGLTHLEGEEVQLLVDGAVVASDTVSGGAVDGDDGTENRVGLGYISQVKPSKLDVEGMGIALTKRITEAVLSFYKTLGGQYGPTTDDLDTIPFRTTETDSAPDLFTGVKELHFDGGYEKEGDVIVYQDQPLPITVRGLILDLGVYQE